MRPSTVVARALEAEGISIERAAGGDRRSAVVLEQLAIERDCREGPGRVAAWMAPGDHPEVVRLELEAEPPIGVLTGVLRFVSAPEQKPRIEIEVERSEAGITYREARGTVTKTWAAAPR